MISRNFIIFGLHLIFLTAVTGAGLVNDICHKVLIITEKAAKLNCSDTAKVYDPNSQHGLYGMDGTGNWVGDVYACLCSCKLPSNPENGQILSKDRICHGETLNYSCNEGYEKSIESKIVCYDSLLMTVPKNLETQYIDVFTRQKSLPDSFANIYSGKVFDLWVNEPASWSIPITELKKNQKVFQLFENKTSLKYYMCGGKGCRLGCVSLKMKGPDCNSVAVTNLECKRNLTETTTTTTIASSSQDPQVVNRSGGGEGVVGVVGGVVGGLVGVVVGGGVVVVIVLLIRKCKNKSLDTPPEPEAPNPHQGTPSSQETNYGYNARN